MAYVKAQPFLPQFVDVDGEPLALGTIEFFLWNTTTPTPYYTDSTGTVGGTSLTLDVLGTPPNDIFWDTSITYKIVTKDRFGSVIETLGPYIVPINESAIDDLLADLASPAGASMIGISQSGKTVQSFFSNDVYIGNGVTAFGRNGNNLARGLQAGGGDISYGPDGTLMAPDGHASWLRLQPSKNESPIELVVYASSAQGIATATIGTSTITRVSGSAFTASWVGKRFYLGSNIYQVATFVDSNNVTVSSVGGSVLPFASTYNETFHVCYISGYGTCSVSGSTVTRLSGDPFIPFVSSLTSFKINGSAVTVSSFTDINTLTLSAPPGNTASAPYTFEANINDQISAFRLQKMLGGNEENLSIYSRYDGYWIHALYSGVGKYRPVFIGSGESSPGQLARQLVCQTNGELTLCGDYAFESVRILPQSSAVNRLEMKGSIAGLSPSFRARGTDTNVGLQVDTQGVGAVTFSSHGLANIEFQVFGPGGTSWLAVASDPTAAPVLSANGAAADIDIKLSPKGAGRVWVGGWTSNADAAINGYITVKDSSGNVRKLATIA